MSNIADRDGLRNVEMDVALYRNIAMFFGPKEKIEWQDSYNPYLARDLFRKLKHIAHARSDTGQEVILSNYISRIEYQIMRRERIGKWYKNLRWYRNWSGRLLMWWRRWSSDFYSSWARPFGWLVGGYLVLNLIPMVWVGDYSWREGLEFSVLSPAKIPFYADSLETVLGTKMTGFNKIGLHVMGIFRLIWIALCGYAFRNAIRTYLAR